MAGVNGRLKLFQFPAMAGDSHRCVSAGGFRFRIPGSLLRGCMAHGIVHVHHVFTHNFALQLHDLCLRGDL